MTRVSGTWLSAAATQEVMGLFREAGHEIYVVGGCVRNALMGRAVTDIDLATDAVPETCLRLAQTAGLKAVPTGIDHGTVTVISGGLPHEITTFRTDVTTDGRHAEVAFSTDIKDDAVRRDFTMNALYADADGQVLDPVGGLPDLEARRVRFVGCAAQRIIEDSLRILRFFRFHAWYGDPAGGIDADGLAACASHVERLQNLSRERIGQEMTRLLAAPDPAPSIAAMAQSGILHTVMPGADPKALGPLVHIEGPHAPDWRRRAVVLGGEDVSDLWRISRRDAQHIALVREVIAHGTPVSETAYRHGRDVAWNAALASAAIFEAPPAPNTAAEVEQGMTAKFPVRASDIPLEGRALGERLKSLEAAWIASGFTLSKGALLAR